MQALVLLDSSAILNDLAFSFNPKRSYAMTSEILAELRDLRSRLMADNAQMLRLLSISDACPLSLQKMRDFVEKKGFSRLSAADLSLLALAKELKGKSQKIVLVSDDYSIQNMCKELKIPFKPAIQGRIKETIVFDKYCFACGKRYKRAFKGCSCECCNSPLKTRKRQQKQKKAQKSTG